MAPFCTSAEYVPFTGTNELYAVLGQRESESSGRAVSRGLPSRFGSVVAATS